MNKEKKKKQNKLTAQCLGIVLVVFALGMFIGYACNYQDVLANIFTGGQADRTHVIHNSSKMAERGVRVGFYILGTNSNKNYTIKFNNKPEKKDNSYVVNGQFTNKTDEHFTTVELNFSLLDKNKNKIGDISAHCDGLNANQTWDFTAVDLQNFKLNGNVDSVILDDVIYTLS